MCLRKTLASILKCLQSFSARRAWATEQLEAKVRNWNMACHSVKSCSQDKVKFHYSGSLCCWGKMVFYSLLTRFSWKLTASSQAPPCFSAGPHRGTHSCLHVPPDTVCSKRFFRECSNGPANSLWDGFKSNRILWQFYSKREKRMKYQMKIILSGCILWKMSLGNAYYGKLTYQVLKYLLGHAACYEPVLFSESCQSSMTLSEGKKNTHMVCLQDHLC